MNHRSRSIPERYKQPSHYTNELDEIDGLTPRERSEFRDALARFQSILGEEWLELVFERGLPCGGLLINRVAWARRCFTALARDLQLAQALPGFRRLRRLLLMRDTARAAEEQVMLAADLARAGLSVELEPQVEGGSADLRVSAPFELYIEMKELRTSEAEREWNERYDRVSFALIRIQERVTVAGLVWDLSSDAACSELLAAVEAAVGQAATASEPVELKTDGRWHLVSFRDETRDQVHEEVANMGVGFPRPPLKDYDRLRRRINQAFKKQLPVEVPGLVVVRPFAATYSTQVPRWDPEVIEPLRQVVTSLDRQGGVMLVLRWLGDHPPAFDADVPGRVRNALRHGVIAESCLLLESEGRPSGLDPFWSKFAGLIE